jgi:hypothetical protein
MGEGQQSIALDRHIADQTGLRHVPLYRPLLEKYPYAKVSLAFP